MATAVRKITLSASRDIPFNKLVLSQSNVRRVKASVSIEELAEDIARRSLLQSLNFRPVLDAEGQETGIFEVPAGGRRFRALELLVKQKRMNKTQPVPCIVRTDGLAEEDSLAENVQRAALHPLDQFRAFQTLREKGLSEEEIAARFFVHPTVVKQRLKLAAVSTKLLDVYAEDGMTLEQLMAFTVTNDQARQEQVWEALARTYNKERYYIRRQLTEGAVRAADKRARFVGVDTYEAAGGAVLRDLFEHDDGGRLQDSALLDRLVIEKLKAEAQILHAEGWKWIAAASDFPFGHTSGLRRLHEPPKPTYRPHLPKNVMSEGLLSDAQLESVIYACDAHASYLAGYWTVDDTFDVVSASPDDAENAVRFRRGWFLGDGTGGGKGRQVVGILLDNWLKGRRRAVWISKSDKLIEDAQHDWSALGQERLLITPLARFRQGTPIRLDQGVLFTTYATLRSAAREEKVSRVQQIVDWLGRDFDGVIVFDESHAMQNAAGEKSERGEQAPSQQGRAGLRLQHALPNARVLYMSATGATTVHNLAYAQRLGLWGGADFPFATRSEFVEAIEAGGVAAMEVLARDLRALGLYAARSLSYEGIEYELADFVRAWEAEVAAVPELTDSELHIVTGLLLPIWKRLPNESMRVYRLQTDDGERIIGRLVSPAWVAQAVDSETPTLSPDDAFAAVLDGRTVLQLQDGLDLRRVKVMGEFRIELSGFSDGMVDRLKAIGLTSEIISWKLRLFVPTGASGPGILAKVMERHLLVRIADKAAA